MAEKTRLESLLSATKDGLTVLRDGLLLLILILLMAAPKVVSSRLEEAGFTSGSFGGLEWKSRLAEAAQRTRSAGESVEKATSSYDALIERLNALESKIADPALRQTVQDISHEATATSAELSYARRAVAESLGAQQQIAEAVAPSLVSATGWIFLGRVTEDKQAWAKAESPTVRSTSPAVAPGTVVVVADDVYLRAEGPSPSHASAPILGVIRAGESVEVQELDYSHARIGGWFAWARIRRK